MTQTSSNNPKETQTATQEDGISATSGEQIVFDKSLFEKLSWKAIITFLVIGTIWQIVSLFSPVYLFPGIQLIAQSFYEILRSLDMLVQLGWTFSRLIIAIVASVIVGVPIGMFMGMSHRIDDYLRPLIKFIMGVPALNWVIIVIVWFNATELRIGFVLLMICTPITIFNVYDGIRSIDQKTIDMVKTFGANPIQMIKLLFWPYVKSFAFTATKINVGVGVRVVIVAELVGAPTGIGKELDLAKSLFDMSLILAWTVWMVLILLLLEFFVEWLENRVLKWRAEEGGKT